MFSFRKVNTELLRHVLMLLSEASKNLSEKGVKQWDYWSNPPQDKIDWVTDGVEKGEFYFVENETNEVMAMFRLQEQDLTYWGEQDREARYIHSLVVRPQFAGQKLGEQIVERIAQQVLEEEVKLLRLDCEARNPQLCAYYEKQGFKKVGEKGLPITTYNLYERELC